MTTTLETITGELNHLQERLEFFKDKDAKEVRTKLEYMYVHKLNHMKQYATLEQREPYIDFIVKYYGWKR